jgi:hypothetical protein
MLCQIRLVQTHSENNANQFVYEYFNTEELIHSHYTPPTNTITTISKELKES